MLRRVNIKVSDVPSSFNIKNSLVYYQHLKVLVFSEFFSQKTKDMAKPYPLPKGSGLLFVFCITNNPDYISNYIINKVAFNKLKIY